MNPNIDTPSEAEDAGEYKQGGTICLFCEMPCDPAPTERGWVSVRYLKGLHFDCAQKVANQGNTIRQIESASTPLPVQGEVPLWYTEKEMYDWLIRNKYSEDIAKELSGVWARDLQGAFKKGWEKARNDNNRTDSEYKYFPVQGVNERAEAWAFDNYCKVSEMLSPIEKEKYDKVVAAYLAGAKESLSVPVDVVEMPIWKGKILMMGGHFVDVNMLGKGVYCTVNPFLHEADFTKESLVQAHRDVQKFSGETDEYIQNIEANLMNCQLIDISIVKTDQQQTT